MDACSYGLRTVEFSGRSTYIVCGGKDVNASLVSIANFLLLSEGPPASLKNATRADGELRVDRSWLVDLVRNLMVQRLRKHVKEGKIPQNHMDELLKSAKREIRKFAVKLDLYPGFESTSCFKCVMSDFTKLLLMGIKADVYHGMLPDPVEDNIVCNLVEGKNLVDFFNFPGNLSEIDKKLISNFMGTTSSLTPYGLSCLQKDVQEHTLSLLWHLCCISVLYKHDGVLYLLRTSGEHPDLMWCSLLNHEGYGDPFSSSFSPINLQEKPEDQQVNPKDVMKDLIDEEEKAKGKEKEEKSKRGKKDDGDGNLQSSYFSPIIIKESEGNDDVNEHIEEEKAKGQKLMEENKAKGREKKKGKHNQAAEPTLRNRFTDFLFGFRKDDCEKSYFMGQIKALNFYENLHLEFDYSLIKEYSENLALSVAANYHSAFEDLELGLKDYLSVAMIKESMTQQDIEFQKDKIDMSAKLKISHLPAPNSVLSFDQFSSTYVLYLVFKFDNLSFDSSTYVGRQMGKGYLKFILRKHKSGWSWNGEFSEKYMFVVIVGSSMEFVITLPAHENFNRDRGVADCNKYIDILVPFYKSHEDATTPWYMDKLKTDFMKMPDHDPMNPEAFDNFQLFIGEHMCWKAPLVRSAFTCNLFRVFRSLVFNECQSAEKKGIYVPLDSTDGLLKWGELVSQFCAPLYAVYTHESKSDSDSRYSKFTFWCALWLGRNATEHLFDYTKVNCVQLITDVIISDLVLEHDLQGILSDVVYKAMELTKFSGEFASIWRHFIASETFDDLENLLCVNGSVGTESADSAALKDTPSKVDVTTAIIIALYKALESLGHSSEAIASVLGALGYSVEHVAASASKSTTAASSSDPTECVTSAIIPKNAASSSVSPEFVASASKPSAANSSRCGTGCVLRHGGATLNRLELMTLQGDGWLGDAVVNYVFALLSTSYKDLCFVRPAISFVLTNLKNADEKIVNAEASGLRLGACNLVLFPVNDNLKFDEDNQGKHWSLLVLQFSNDRSKCRFIYHDSLYNRNLSHARRLAGVLSHVLPKVTDFVEADSPQQTNNCDCGVFVLAMAKAIGDWWKKYGQREDTGSFQDDWIQSLKADVTQGTVTLTRLKSYNKLDEQLQKVEQGCK